MKFTFHLVCTVTLSSVGESDNMHYRTKLKKEKWHIIAAKLFLTPVFKHTH